MAGDALIGADRGAPVVGLPRGLADWREELAAFPSDVTLTLEPWLLRLDAALGRLRSHEASSDGPPDGFAGLERKGRYERLLVSEWLLAEVAPDEFTRRAAAAEHLFYALARRDHAADTRTAALFDAGPEQLGAPRLAHLALLVVLARRARQSGARFMWGVLQADPPRPQPGLTEDAVRSLLDRRSRRAANEADLVRWADALGGGLEGDDLWLVGRPALREIWPGRGRRATVQDPRVLGARRLDVDLDGRSLTLDLPPERIAIRMLRNPFAAPPAPGIAPDALPRGDALCFSSDGRQVFVRCEVGVVMHPLPHGRGQAGQPRLLSGRGAEVYAVGTTGKTVYLFCGGAGGAQVLEYSRRGRLQTVHTPDPAAVTWTAHGSGAVLPWTRLGRAPEAPWAAIDGQHRLLGCGAWPDAPLEALMHGVAAMGHRAGGLDLVVDKRLMTPAVLRADEVPRLFLQEGLPDADELRPSRLPTRVRMTLDRQGRLDRLSTLAAGDRHAARVAELPDVGGRRAVVATAMDEDTWTLSEAAGRSPSIRVGRGEVLGIVGTTGDRPRSVPLGLATLDEDRQSVGGWFADRDEALHVLRYPAAQWAWCAHRAWLAYLDPDGALHVEDIVDGSEILRVALPRSALPPAPKTR